MLPGCSDILLCVLNPSSASGPPADADEAPLAISSLASTTRCRTFRTRGTRIDPAGEKDTHRVRELCDPPGRQAWTRHIAKAKDG
jgi:hypothetical protein